MGVKRAKGGGGLWPRRLVGGLLITALAGPLGAPGRAGGAATATALQPGPQPFNTSLVMTSTPGALGDSVAIDGEMVVWADAAGALFAYRLAEGREIRLLEGPARRSELALDGGVLVWTERDGGGAVIRGLRLAEGGPFTIAEGPGDRNGPAVSGSVVVWRDRRGGDWHLWGYDLEAQREFPVLTGAGNVGGVRVAGSTVIWEDHRTGSWNLDAYDLASRREYPVTSGPDDDTAPSLGPDALVFVRRAPGQSAGAIVLRDLRTGEERTIVQGHLALRPILADGLVVWEDWRDGVPNVWAYDRESSRAFPLTRSEQARGPAVATGRAAVVAWLSRGAFTSRVTAVRLVRPLPSDPQDPPTVTDPNARYFPESRHNLGGTFRFFWNVNGGLDIFGLPLTEAFDETDARGVTRRVQYFERAKLEADPLNPSTITVARLGSELTEGRSFPPVEPFASGNDRIYVAETRHSLSGWFKEYWEANGALSIFGYPISEEMNEGGRLVQYFERSRFELRPGARADDPRRVDLGQLGREALIKRGWLSPAPPTPGTRP